MNSDTASPWITDDVALDYITQGQRTPNGRRKFSTRFLKKEVDAGRLRAARVGGRKQLFFRREWLDQWLENQAKPVPIDLRRRAG